jgi:hypothetical protein
MRMRVDPYIASPAGAPSKKTVFHKNVLTSFSNVLSSSNVILNLVRKLFSSHHYKELMGLKVSEIVGYKNGMLHGPQPNYIQHFL